MLLLATPRPAATTSTAAIPAPVKPNLPGNGEQSCISCKFGHQMAQLVLVANLATRWRHMHRLQIWPPHGATCMSCKFGLKMAPHA